MTSFSLFLLRRTGSMLLRGGYALLFCFTMLIANAQSPVAYWDFNDSEDPLRSLPQGLRLKGKVELAEHGNRAGQYLKFTSDNNHLVTLPGEYPKALTVEVMMRFSGGSFREEYRLIYTNHYSFFVQVTAQQIVFGTAPYRDGQQLPRHSLKIKLTEMGMNSLGYFLDDGWHQLVFRYDAVSGKKAIMVDGKQQPEWQAQLEPADRLCPRPAWEGTRLYLNAANRQRGIVGDIDELALYDRYTSDALHQNRWAAYRLTLPAPAEPEAVPEAIPQSRDIVPPKMDPMEYLPGDRPAYQDPLLQLQHFPRARYRKGHQLNRLHPWVDLANLAGRHRADQSQAASVAQSLVLQEELAGHWHYYLSLGNSASYRNAYGQAWIKLANQHPEWPLTVITLWPQTDLRVIGQDQNRAHVLRSNLAPDYYLRNNQGQYLNSQGKVDSRARLLSPAADVDAFRLDGKAQAAYLKGISRQLTRPLDLVNENGEVPFLPYSEDLLAKDPRVVRDFNASGTADWATYQSDRKTRQRLAYRDALLAGLPRGNQTHFTWYGIDGGPLRLNRFAWREARRVNLPLGGQYYATPDFYPRWPDNWEKWKGAWRGFEWLQITRRVELAQGDELFSPFVAAGWEKDPTQNIRPSQWLGLLKCLGPTGAEFYYVGHFNEKAGEAFPNPADYVWQVALPAYAQAITSFYEPILRDGELLKNEKGEPLVRVWAGDPRILLTIRKQKGKKRYIIATNINPSSNYLGAVPDELEAVFQIDEQVYQVKTRRQGSVYLLDEEDPANPLFYQLDSWHQAGHPLNWSQAVYLAAPLYDSQSGCKIKTIRPVKASRSDFRRAQGGIVAQGSSKYGRATYCFELNALQGAQKWKLELQALSLSGQRGKAVIWIDGERLSNCRSIRSKTLETVSVARNLHLSEGTHTVEIELKDPDIWVHTLIFTPQ